MSEGYVGVPTTSTTTTGVPTPSTSTTTSTSSTTSTTSTSTTVYVPYPTFSLSSVELPPPAKATIYIYNVTNGTRYNYSVGSTYTGSNNCATPMGFIDPDAGNTTVVITDKPCGTVYTVRVYNYTAQPNCSIYTDHTITLCAN
jgi:hypothetical protein